MRTTTDSIASISPLFERGRFGKLELPNRFVQSALYTLFATTWGEAGEKIIEYFRVRARGGAGLIITENTTVDWAVGRAAGNPLRIDHDRFRAAMRDLTEAVHNEGAKIALQLHHSGRQNSAWNIDTGEPPMAPTAGITSAFGSPPREIRLEEIPLLVDKFAQGARRAVEAGFDAVELHGAHGYLPSQFLSPKTNRRTDAYGGSLENRARFAMEVVAAIRKMVGPDFPIIYRLSVEEPYEGGLQLQDGLAFARMVEPHIDALHITAGNYDTVRVMTSMGLPGELLHYALAVRELVRIPVIAIRRMNWLLTDTAKAIAEQKIDFIAIGRGMLADPALVKKLA